MDSAQRLVNSKGYERMTIQDILDDLQISKGAFYHYFSSKESLLEAIIKRMIDTGEQIVIPILEDLHLSALEKFQRFFDSMSRWKTTQKTFLLEMMKGYFSDENAILGQKVRAEGVKQFAPLLTEIIRQGVREETMTTPYPDQVAEVILALEYGFADRLGGLLLAARTIPDIMQRMADTVAVYTDAHERLLGIAPGTLNLIDMETLKEWAVSVQEQDSPQNP